MEAGSNLGKGLDQETLSSAVCPYSYRMGRECIAAVHLLCDYSCEKMDEKHDTAAADGTPEYPVASNLMSEFESSTQAYRRPDNKKNLA